MNQPDVSIIIINYHTAQLVSDCVNSIIKNTKEISYETLIIDNSNDSKEFESLSNKVKTKSDLILNPQSNLGFGKANNYAAKYAKGRNLLFLNSDTLLTNNAVKILCNVLDSDSTIGIVGGNLYKPNGKPCHSFIKSEMNPKMFKSINSTRYAFACKYLKRFDFNYSKRNLEIKGYITGADLMIRKSVFEKLNGFDEHIFMYAEDSLLCYRCIHELNLKIIQTPKSKITHLEGGSDYKEFSLNKIDNWISGNCWYYKFAFGNSGTNEFLNYALKEFKKKKLLFKLLRMKEKIHNYSNYVTEIEKVKQRMNKEQNIKILVTGAKGQLGYDCIRELKERGYKNVLGIDRDEMDITDEKSVMKFITDYHPDVVMHNAAWTAVDKAEQMPDEVYKVNSLGPKYVAEACKAVGATMFYISTDYIFDGKGTKFFETNAPKNGLSVYGKTKGEGEDFVTSILSKYFIIRISWVFGINGHNFVKTMLSLADQGHKELNVVDDQIGSPTYTYDLSKLICDMMVTNKYGIYHATNEGVCSWAEFASFIFKTAGLDVKVNPVSTEEYMKLVPNQASRPYNSLMSKDSLTKAGFNKLPTWQDAVTRYIHDELKR